MERFRDVRAAMSFGADGLRKVNLFGSPRMFCDVYGLDPGQEQRVHAHDAADKVYYVLEGSGVFRVGEDEREAGAGQAVWAPAGEAHGVRNPGPGRLALLVFMAPNPSRP